ncbi:hypothetical protein ABQE69_14365 [Mycolicibacillus trivialis]
MTSIDVEVSTSSTVAAATVWGSAIVSPSRTAVGRVQRDEDVAERGGRPQFGGGADRQPHPVDDLHLHHRGVVLGAHRHHLADVGAADADLGPVGQVQRVGEDRIELVGGAADSRRRQREILHALRAASQHRGRQHR